MHDRLDEGPDPYAALWTDPTFTWAWKVAYLVIVVTGSMFFWAVMYEVTKGSLDDNRRLRQARVDEAEAQRRAWTQAEHWICDREMLKLVLASTPAQQDNEVCTHKFHFECGTEWFERSFTCPRCTQEMMWVAVLRKDVQAVYGVNLDDA